MHVSNVPVTDAYWTSSRFKMKAAIFYSYYIKEDEISLFHTWYLDKYHEPHLRSLLSKYTSQIGGLPGGYSESIMEGYDFFINAVQTYKHVVTHYLSSKMELWTGIFMKPLFDIASGSLTFEFDKSRGAIHYHCIL